MMGVKARQLRAARGCLDSPARSRHGPLGLERLLKCQHDNNLAHLPHRRVDRLWDLPLQQHRARRAQQRLRAGRELPRPRVLVGAAHDYDRVLPWGLVVWWIFEGPSGMQDQAGAGLQEHGLLCREDGHFDQQPLPRR